MGEEAPTIYARPPDGIEADELAMFENVSNAEDLIAAFQSYKARKAGTAARCSPQVVLELVQDNQLNANGRQDDAPTAGRRTRAKCVRSRPSPCQSGDVGHVEKSIWHATAR